MKQVTRFTSTYSSDEFGVCSALYELGGMVVMHDASGCNSTYTTHDEPRWYDTDSMIFISAISEMEAVMGDDDKLIRDLIETATQLHPAFIAIVGAPIPYMIGTDLTAIASVVERSTGIPSFGFAANGMHGYLNGISMALERIADRFCIRDVDKTERLSVNIIGATPLDFSLNGSVDSIRGWIREHDMEPGVCFAMGSTLDELRLAGRAHVNLVVSYGGLAAARRLRELFGTPYIVGVPFGKAYADHLADVIKHVSQTGAPAVSYQPEALPPQRTKKLSAGETHTPLAIIGESVCAASLASAVTLETGIPVRLLCPLETEDFLLRAGDLRTPEEEDLIRELQHACGVIADPLYRPLCRKDAIFYELPHEAFSGRIYDPVNPDLINKALKANHTQEDIDRC